MDHLDDLVLDGKIELIEFQCVGWIQLYRLINVIVHISYSGFYPFTNVDLLCFHISYEDIVVQYDTL
jgi:hypothetical protein